MANWYDHNSQFQEQRLYNYTTWKRTTKDDPNRHGTAVVKYPAQIVGFSIGGVHNHYLLKAEYADTIFNVIREITYIHERSSYY